MRCGKYSRSLLLNLGIALVLVAAVVAIYAQTFSFGSVRLDDPEYLAGSVHLENGLSVDGLRWAFTTSTIANYIPLALASHMLDRTLFGDNLGGHHLTSVLFHALNSVLLFAALFSMTRARWPSAVVAILFAVHPLNVESVAWISERKNVLSTTFWILSMWAYAGYAKRPCFARYLGVALLFALGLLAKPMLVTVPLVFLLLDCWPLDRIRWGRPKAAESAPSLPRRSIGFLIAEKLPLLALSAAASVVTLHAQSREFSSMKGLRVDPSENLANAVVAYARYLGKTAWPVDLTVLYPHPYIPELGGIPLGAWQIAGAVTLLLALSVLAIAAVRRRYLLVGWFWFLGTLVPTIGFVQVGYQALADRYAYVSAIGLFLAVSWAGSEWVARLRISRPGSSRALLVAVAAGIAALALASWYQVGYWRDSATLFEHTLSVIPKNPVARYSLANEYLSRGNMEAAIRNYRIAIKLSPGHQNAHAALGVVLAAQKKFDEAISQFRWVIAASPRYAPAHNNLGDALRAQGKLEEAVAAYEEALRVDPGLEKASENLENVKKALAASRPL